MTTSSQFAGIRFFRNTLVLATSFALLSVMTLSGPASAVTPSTTAVTSIAVGTQPRGVAVSPDGSSVWVANVGSGTVSRINTTTNAVTSIAVDNGPIGVAVSPDGSSVWVT
ncbi:MAG: YncE family protein, partial [Actinobacteria bacterium]|nr:YncE family protein [Actinomycetota bacterium]